MHRLSLKLIVCLVLALGAAPASAGFDQALAAFEAGNYPAALNELQPPLAENGDALIQLDELPPPAPAGASK